MRGLHLVTLAALALLPASTGQAAGDAARGRALLVDRHVSLCLLCHHGPFSEVTQQGDLAPGLEGAGARWSTAQLRARLLEPRSFVPDSIMPAFGPVSGLQQVAPAWRDRPILDSWQIDDVVAFLATLRD